MQYFYVKNWQKFQHYKHRNPPWVKLHYEIFTSADWVVLADASKLLAVVCMLVASRNDGRVPNDPAFLKRVAYLSSTPNLKPLIECGFLLETLADASNSKQLRTNADTETETEKEKERSSTDENVSQLTNGTSPVDSPLPTGKNYEFDGKVVRLSQKDWNLWLKAYSYLDLRAELTARDAWLASDATEADRGRWFVSTSKYLANRNAEAKALRPSGVGGITRLPNGEVDMRSLGIV